MSDAEMTDAADRTIHALGSSLLFHEVTLEVAAERGITDPFVLYAAGRAGVMGDVGPAAVRSAFGFFPLEAVEELWATVPDWGTPSEIAAVYAEGMAEVARRRWDPTAALTVARLGGELVDSVVPLGMALFAGWQALPRPDDVGAAAIVVAALRELRGDVHLQAVALEGLHPLEAEVVSRGEAGAELHRWPRPYPDPEPLRERVAAAERATSQRMHRLWGALGADQQAELCAAVADLAAA